MPQPCANPLTLAIEMSNPSMWPDPLISGEVALGRTAADAIDVLGVEPIRLTQARDEALAPAVDRLCRRLGVDLHSVERVAVSAGPGGFSAVRVAMITAKAIAEAIGAGLVVVPTAEAIVRHRCRDGRVQGSVLIALAGKRDSAWCVLYPGTARDHALRPTAEICGVVTAEDLAASEPAQRAEYLVADAHIPEPIRRWAEHHGKRIVAPESSAEAVMIAAAHHPMIDPVEAAPIYPREPEAVTKWREREQA